MRVGVVNSSFDSYADPAVSRRLVVEVELPLRKDD